MCAARLQMEIVNHTGVVVLKEDRDDANGPT